MDEKNIGIADELAYKAHSGAFRKDGKTHYITHPRRVAACVRANGGGQNAIIGALWHDVDEDTNYRVNSFVERLEVSRNDKAEIVAIVNALTKNMDIKPRKARQQEVIVRLKQAPPEAVLVKLCDRADNLYDVEPFSDDFLKLYLRETDELMNEVNDYCPKHRRLCNLIRNRVIELRRDRLGVE
jgi:(p)ppGpp synthase/HD superfamily hydrolase